MELYRFTVDQYEALVRHGVLTEDDPVELWEGHLVMMTPIGDRHVKVTDRLMRALVRAVGDRAIVSVQSPIRLEASEPEPDVVVKDAEGVVDAEHVLLVVEVSETSLERDQEKVSGYARAGIPEAWIVDLDNRILLRHREPGPQGYGRIDRLSETVDLPLDGGALDVASLLTP